MKLKMLLRKENIEPPYILVGHSSGVNIIRYYAHQFPDEVAGLVLIDGCPDHWYNYFKANHTKKEVQMFEGVMNQYRNQLTGVSQEEWDQEEYNMAFMQGIEIPPDIPVRIITSTRYTEMHSKVGYRPEDMTAWAKLQAGLLKNVKNGKQIITEKSGHDIQNTEPELIIEAARDLIELYRNK